MDSVNRAHNNLFLIAQSHKIGVLQVVVSDEDVCNWNGKPSHPPSHILNLLPLLPYPTNTITRTHIP